MGFTFTRRVDVTDPDDLLAWRTFGGALRDFTGWTMSMEIIDPVTNVIQYTKTSGIAGGDGTGSSNVALAWSPEEMAPLAGLKRWKGRILATQGSEKSEFTLDSDGTLPVWVFEPAPTIETP